MSTFPVSKIIPRPIAHMGFARNTLPVMGVLAKKIWQATNHCVAYRRKLVFSDSMDIQSIRAGEAGTKELWSGRFHAGEGVISLIARVGLAPMGSSGTDGEVYLTVGGDDTAKIHQAPMAGSLTDIADNFSYSRITFDITEDTTYEWSLKVVDYARPFSLALWELATVPVDDTLGGTVDPGIGVGSPILDSQHADLLPDLFDLWKHNAVHLKSWSKQVDTSITFSTSGTYTNLFDGSTTGGAATTAPGFTLETTYHDRIKHDVPIVFGIRASVQSGASASAQLVNTSNSSLIEITGISTTHQWWVKTTTLPAGTKFLTVEVKSPGGVTMDVDAFTIYEYLA